MNQTSDSPSYWIIVGSPENFERTKEIGFRQQGIKSRHRKKVERMKPGDKIVYYLTGKKIFSAVSTITSTSFESHEPVWKSSNAAKAAEDYPYRVETEPDLVLDERDWVPAEGLARQMEYAKKWPAEHWTLAFQGNVHEIGQSDYELIRSALVQESAVTPS